MPARVRGRERVGDLNRVAQRILKPQPLLRNQRIERPALDQFHGEILGAIVGRADVEDGDDVRVLERGGELRFLQEPASPLAIGDEIARQNLERDLPIETTVRGLIHLAHAPTAEQGADFIGTKARAGGQGQVPALYGDRPGLFGSAAPAPGDKHKGPAVKPAL